MPVAIKIDGLLAANVLFGANCSISDCQSYAWHQPNRIKVILTIKRRIVRLVVGWTFLVLGIIGLVLPVLQGLLFLAVGVLMLAPDVPMFGKVVSWIRRRYPRIGKKAGRIVDKIEE